MSYPNTPNSTIIQARAEMSAAWTLGIAPRVGATLGNSLSNARNSSNVNPFESADPVGAMSSYNRGFLQAEDLRLLRAQRFPGAGHEGLTLVQAITDFIGSGHAEQDILAWFDSLGIEVKLRSKTVHIDVTDGSPVACLYRSHGCSHLGPNIRQDAGYIEFHESQAPGDVRVIVVFPLSSEY